MPGNEELDLGAGAGATPHLEAGADAVGALAHARKPPMTVAARAQHLLVDAASVVANEHAHLRRRVLDRHFDLLPARVPDRVHERLATDAIDLVADERMEGPRAYPRR